MTIKRLLDGKEYEIELTTDEIIRAAAVNERFADMEMVQDYIEDLGIEDELTEEMMSEFAQLFRHYCDNQDLIYEARERYLDVAFDDLARKYMIEI